ncbi:MAG: hypothetical protein ABWY19_00320 [Marmoricola sp.]
MTRWRAGLLVAVVVVLVGGCAVGTDDELAPPPTRTVTATPSQSLAPAPASVPVGEGDVSPTDVVWTEGSVLHVGRRQVDLSPIDVEALVVVDGGVFALTGGELWFTDLRRVRGTAQTAVTGLRTTADARYLEVVDTRSGQPATQAYDAETGKAVRQDVDTVPPAERRQGPGRYHVRTGGGPARVVDTDSGRQVRLAGLPSVFEVGMWTGETEFYGVGGSGTDRRMVSCDLVAHRCTPVVAVTGTEPLVFPTGR